MAKKIKNQDLLKILKLNLKDEILEAVQLVNLIEEKEAVILTDYQKFFLQKKLLLVKAHWKKHNKSCNSR